MADILKILLAIVSIPLMILLDSYVVSVLWSWFLVPLGVMAIGMAHAYGVCVLFAVVRYRPERPDREVKDWWEPLMRGFLYPSFGLFMGWCAHGCM